MKKHKKFSLFFGVLSPHMKHYSPRFSHTGVRKKNGGKEMTLLISIAEYGRRSGRRQKSGGNLRICLLAREQTTMTDIAIQRPDSETLFFSLSSSFYFFRRLNTKTDNTSVEVFSWKFDCTGEASEMSLHFQHSVGVGFFLRFHPARPVITFSF